MKAQRDLFLLREVLLVGTLVVILVATAFFFWGEPVVRFFRDQSQIRAWVASFGLLAPLVSIGLNTAQVLLAPVPGQVVALSNGYLFGVFWGTVYSLIGVILGSALAMGLGRWLGRPVVERLLRPEKLDRWDGLAERHGTLFFFLVFLLPLVPDDIACFAVGLSTLSIPYILALATIGRLPGLIAGSWLGHSAGHLSMVGWVLVGAGTVILGVIVLRHQARIEAALLRLAGKWSKHKYCLD